MQGYVDIDQRLHLLCQILAKVTANFIPEKEDYSHTNLAFDTISNRISSRWMQNSKGNVFLALNLDSSMLQWINESLQVIGEFKITGKTFAQIESELLSSLTSVGFDSNELSAKLKYEIEEYPFKDLPVESMGKESINSWTTYRSLANQACEAFLNHINGKEEVRIWPHHFDTGVYKEIRAKLGIGFGLAVKDSLANTPYFYLSGYGLQDKMVLKDLTDLEYGSWKTGDLNGAILSLTALEQIQDQQKIKVINSFIKSTLDWYLNNSLK